MKLPSEVSGGAESDDRYRFILRREWSGGRGRLCVVMLNPSTADANVDDKTIRMCTRWGQRWGFAGLDVVNLYARRATRPKDLWNLPEAEWVGSGTTTGFGALHRIPA